MNNLFLYDHTTSNKYRINSNWQNKIQYIILKLICMSGMNMTLNKTRAIIEELILEKYKFFWGGKEINLLPGYPDRDVHTVSDF